MNAADRLSQLETNDVESRTWTLRLYDHHELSIAGPEKFLEAVADYFWPQARSVAPHPGQLRVELVVGRVRPGVTAAAEPCPVTLYASPDGYVPDFNEGVVYTGLPGVDRLVVNPHTGSGFLVTRDRVRIVNPDPSLGTRDALRVVKQMVSTGFEAAGVLTVHASGFAMGGDAFAVTGPKGAGKTTTVLAAVAAGARLVSNDRLYARADTAGTDVLGWTDPIRLIDAPDRPKRVVSLASYFSGDTGRVAVGPLPLRAIVVPEVSTESAPIRCEELDSATGAALVREEVLPARARWLGIEPAPLTDARPPSAERCLRLSYGYKDAAQAADLLLKTLARHT
ncbi:hypothetical protein PV396_40765 [Streptomyces sp. ME02-8801-2C]|uniref:hypothetical protein n=1 Tax=Streptomyces sp. ME02-8801-2C TaxID=3028680 RepID=UPI0029A2085E|nr:hypothetical protein [Streptomyces sp. ME02-8801-2C]MDX3458200.1 hypothetical protein [Streptomyces sp. ME02-8801-2C]